MIDRQFKNHCGYQNWDPFILQSISANWFFFKRAKPSLKIRTASAIFFIYLGIFRDNGLKNIFRNKTFFVFQDRKLKLLASVFSWNLTKFQLIVIFIFSFGCLILWGFMKFFFKQMRVSAFYLENKKVLFLEIFLISKQKSFVYWPNFQWRFWSRFQS